MTVRELIEALGKIHPDTKVVVRGYENGYNDVVSLRERNIMVQNKAKWWDGRYIETDNSSIAALEIFGDNQIPDV
jgi:hypothetical protein